jgi:hypothetical protein
VDESLAPSGSTLRGLAECRHLVIEWHRTLIHKHEQEIVSLRKLRVDDIPRRDDHV